MYYHIEKMTENGWRTSNSCCSDRAKAHSTASRRARDTATPHRVTGDSIHDIIAEFDKYGNEVGASTEKEGSVMFKVGQKVRDGMGRSGIVLATDLSGNFPLLVHREDTDGHKYDVCYTKEGRYLQCTMSNSDLLPPTPEKRTVATIKIEFPPR